MKNIQKIFGWTLLIICIVCSVVLSSHIKIGTYGEDARIFWDAGRAVMAGQNPYKTVFPPFYTPAWSLAFFIPFSFVPLGLAIKVWTVIQLVAWTFILYRMKRDPVTIALFVLNPFFCAGLALGSYDWLALLGAVIPPVFGVWFAFLKPQATIGSLITWALKQPLLKAAGVLLPPLIALGILAWVGLNGNIELDKMTWNSSMGWAGVPLGIFLIGLAYKNKSGTLSLAASPFLSPYVGLPTWGVVLLPFLKSRLAMAVALVGAWGFFILRFWDGG